MKTPTQTTSDRFKTIRHVLFAAGLAALIVPTAQAQLPLPIYEPFPASYTNGTPDETVAVPANGSSLPTRRIRNAPTTSVWSIGGSAGGGSPLVAGGPAALSYPGLYQDISNPSIGAFIRTNLTTANRTAGILFPTVSAGSVYASFLINVQQTPTTTNKCLVKFETATTGNGSAGGSGAMVGVMLTPEGKLALSKSSTTVAGITNGTVLSAGTHLVVMRYTWNPGTDDDEVALWLDPGSLAAGSAPAPSVTLVTGTDVPSISSFYIQAPQTSPPQVAAEFFLDEIRIATSWAEVTPNAPLCTTASIATPPADQTVFEGIQGTFSVIAGGTSPTFQWQLSTNSGVNWNNVSGATSQTLLTSPTALTDNGHRYRAVASVACNSSSVTSAPAILTVTAAVKTTNGVAMDDTFADNDYNSFDITTVNSIWLQSTPGTLDATSGALVATSSSNAVTWLGFFTGTNQPVDLDIGRALKGTLVFKANNITSNGGNFRIGFFDYNDGGTRPVIDGATVANSGVGVRGYMSTINYGTNFTANPFSLYARNNLVADLMGTTGNFLGLGGGPAGYTNFAPAFQNGVTYTAEFTLARQALTHVDFTVSFTGGGTNWTYTNDDTNYCYPRFDAVAIRSGSAATAADSFEISEFKVEVITAAVTTPTAIPLSISSGGGNVTLTWTNPAFSLQAAPIVTGTYTNIPGAASPYTVPIGGATRFFRLIFP